MSSPKSPWKDRTQLLKDISSFVNRHNSYFKQNVKKISGLVELCVYNDVVRYYVSKGFTRVVKNVSKDGTFKFRLVPTGLAEGFSYYEIYHPDNSTKFEIHQNLRNQSAHNPEIYFSADVSVCNSGGTITKVGKRGKRYSYIKNSDLKSFVEVKHMNPFPEVLFSFIGIINELSPQVIQKVIHYIKFDRGLHLTPSIVFSGLPNDQAKIIINELKQRYGINVFTGLFRNKGSILSFYNTNEYVV